MSSPTPTAKTEPKRMYRNHYHCSGCNISWSDDWECACNDRCPQCDREIEPHESHERLPQYVTDVLDEVGAIIEDTYAHDDEGERIEGEPGSMSGADCIERLCALEARLEAILSGQRSGVVIHR